MCLQLVDRLLEHAALTTFSDLTQAVDIVMTPDNAALQNFLEAFVEAAESTYGCVMVGGCIAVATKKWWSLSATELMLLSLLVSTLTPCTSRDIPIYLPHGSPLEAHRLLTFQLMSGIEVCVICGPMPNLTDLQAEVVRFWFPAVEVLKSVIQVIPRNFPASINIDQNIMGFLIVNNQTSRCLNSVHLHRNQVDRNEIETRKEILRSFFRKVVGTYFSSSAIKGSERGPAEFSHVPTDTYIVCEGYKCYALSHGMHQIFVLYSSAIPTYAMRSITNKTLNIFVNDRNLII